MVRGNIFPHNPIREPRHSCMTIGVRSVGDNEYNAAIALSQLHDLNLLPGTRPGQRFHDQRSKFLTTCHNMSRTMTKSRSWPNPNVESLTGKQCTVTPIYCHLDLQTQRMEFISILDLTHCWLFSLHRW